MRTAIKRRTDIGEITKRVSERLGIAPEDISKVINFYWIDMDMMFTYNCGFAAQVKKFCTFWIYTSGTYGQFKELDHHIRKQLRFIALLRSLGQMTQIPALSEEIARDLTKFVLLDYTIKEYEQFVLPVYPWKYKVTHKDRIAGLVEGLERLFGVPLSEFPITINYPVQEMYVRHLRKIGLLQNPVIRNLKTYRGNYKGRAAVVEDKEVQ